MPDGGMVLLEQAYPTGTYQPLNLLVHLDRGGGFVEASTIPADPSGRPILDGVALPDGSFAVAGSTVGAPSLPSPLTDISVTALSPLGRRHRRLARG